MDASEALNEIIGAAKGIQTEEGQHHYNLSIDEDTLEPTIREFDLRNSLVVFGIPINELYST